MEKVRQASFSWSSKALNDIKASHSSGPSVAGRRLHKLIKRDEAQLFGEGKAGKLFTVFEKKSAKRRQSLTFISPISLW